MRSRVVDVTAVNDTRLLAVAFAALVATTGVALAAATSTR
jgi:hypothetical protein